MNEGKRRSRHLGALAIGWLAATSCSGIPPLEGAPLGDVVKILGMDVPGHLADLRAAEEGDSYAKLSLVESILERGLREFGSVRQARDPESGAHVVEYAIAELDRMVTAGFGPAAESIVACGFNPRVRRDCELPAGLVQLDAAGAFRILERGANARLPSADACIALASVYIHERDPDVPPSTIAVANPDRTFSDRPPSASELEEMKYRNWESLGHAIGRELGLKYQPERAFKLWDRACVSGLSPNGTILYACNSLYWILQRENAFCLGPQPELAEGYRKLGVARQASIDAIMQRSAERREALADEERYEMDRRYLEEEIDDAERMQLFATSLEAIRRSFPQDASGGRRP